MEDSKEQKNKTENTNPAPVAPVAKVAPRVQDGRNVQNRERRPRRRDDRPRSEYDQKTIQVRRVARVTKGGKRFNISLVLAIGNHRGVVGVGTGKGVDTALAIDKAMRAAKRNLITVPVTKTMSIPHAVYSKYSSAIVKIMPAPQRGNIAGSALRDILWLAGLKDVNAKILSGSKNKLNIARAAIEALKQLKPARS
ncbi:MAG TPA: 30S ribosomal protein S5 [Candidatus Paceibacterota bacterium]